MRPRRSEHNRRIILNAQGARMMRYRTIAQAVAVVAAVACSVVLLSAQDHPPAGGAHRHPDAEKMKNPVAADATSLAAGQKLYDKNCASCHGATGKGEDRKSTRLNS